MVYIPVENPIEQVQPNYIFDWNSKETKNPLIYHNTKLFEAEESDKSGCGKQKFSFFLFNEKTQLLVKEFNDLNKESFVIDLDLQQMKRKIYFVNSIE